MRNRAVLLAFLPVMSLAAVVSAQTGEIKESSDPRAGTSETMEGQRQQINKIMATLTGEIHRLEKQAFDLEGEETLQKSLDKHLIWDGLTPMKENVETLRENHTHTTKD